VSAPTTNYRRLYEYKRYAGIPTSLVDAAPARTRLQHLLDIGWNLTAIEPVTGLTDHGMRLILNGTHSTTERRSRAGIMRMPVTLAVPDAVADDSFVPADGATRRVRALLAIGWTRDDIARRLARTNPAHLARGSYPAIKAYRWREVADVYEALSMRRGPSHITANRCVKLGYLPPLSWDDIDDPAENPTGGRYATTDVDLVVVRRILGGDWSHPANRAERFEVLARWTDSDNELERRTGWNVARMRRDLRDAA
jgi:hypothetical protein